MTLSECQTMSDFLDVTLRGRNFVETCHFVLGRVSLFVFATRTEPDVSELVADNHGMGVGDCRNLL